VLAATTMMFQSALAEGVPQPSIEGGGATKIKELQSALAEGVPQPVCAVCHAQR